MSDRFTSTPGLTAAVDGTRLTVTLDSPTRRNALDDTSMSALIKNLEAAAIDDELRVILLRGAGGDFCSGFDIVGRNADRDHKPRTAHTIGSWVSNNSGMSRLAWTLILRWMLAVRGL